MMAHGSSARNSIDRNPVLHFKRCCVERILISDMPSNPSVKFVPAFGLHGARRKRRAPYLKR